MLATTPFRTSIPFLMFDWGSRAYVNIIYQYICVNLGCETGWEGRRLVEARKGSGWLLGIVGGELVRTQAAEISGLRTLVQESTGTVSHSLSSEDQLKQRIIARLWAWICLDVARRYKKVLPLFVLAKSRETVGSIFIMFFSTLHFDFKAKECSVVEFSSSDAADLWYSQPPEFASLNQFEWANRTSLRLKLVTTQGKVPNFY